MAASSKSLGTYYPGDEDFIAGVQEAQLAQSTPRASWAIYLMMAVLITAAVWAAAARVDEVTKAEGRVVPDGREQVISSLEGGLLASLLVREGVVVDQGQDLLQLDPTRVEAQQAEGRAKQLALKAQVARLEAESGGQVLHFPPDVLAQPRLVHGETEIFRSRRQGLEEAVGTMRRSLALLNRELTINQRLSAAGLISEVEVMRLRRQVNDIDMQIQDRINRFRQDASTDLVRARTDLAQIEEQMVVKQDVLQRSTLKSPVHGVVKNIRIATVGGVVAPGAPIMEILPIGPKVLVEARIKPADIGFIKVGQNAEIKLSAYDYFIYGGLKGTIQYISPDALGEDANNPKQDQAYYRAVVSADASHLKAGSKPLQVIPGMNGTVEIRTGERTVMDYLLRPMMKSREAFRER